MSERQRLNRPALGRGIEALLGDSGQSSAPSELSIDAISPNPDQPRSHFNHDELAELAKSITNHGILQPLIVERDGDRYRIIAGERRFRAARLAGLSRVPAVIRSTVGVQHLELALIENLQRSDLNPIEEARGYRRLMELDNQTQDQVAQRVGKSRVSVTNALRLLNLPEIMIASLEQGDITAGHGRALLALSDLTSQKRLFERIVTEKLSVRAAEAAVHDDTRVSGKTSSLTPSNPTIDPDLIAIEQQLMEALGTKVNVRGNIRRGRIAVDYYSPDDLERICERIGITSVETDSLR